MPIPMPAQVRDYQELSAMFITLAENDYGNISLDYFKEILRFLGNPEMQIGEIFHITGTNGKGTVSLTLAKALEDTSKKVGLYQSPHLYSYCERIGINGKMIPTLDLIRIVNQLLSRLREPGAPPISLGPIGLLVCSAFIYFKENKTDYVIIEAGIGAKLDQTNVLMPSLSIITSIGFDHVSLLCNRKSSDLSNTSEQDKQKILQEILSDKAEIIKKSRPIIAGYSIYRNEEYRNIIAEKATMVGSPIHYITEEAQHFTAENKATALKALQVYFNDPTYTLPKRAFEALPPARYQKVNAGGKCFLFDVGHNFSAIQALFERWENETQGEKFSLFFGMQLVKDYQSVCQYLNEKKYLIKKIYLIPPEKSPAPIEEMKNLLKAHDVEPIHIDQVKTITEKEKGPFIITGSFYLVGPISRALGIDLMTLNEAVSFSSIVQKSTFFQPANITNENKNFINTVSQKKERLVVTLLKEIAEEYGLKFSAFSGDYIIELINPKTNQKRFVFGNNFGLNSDSISEICTDKAALSDLLTNHQVPNIEHKLFLHPELKGWGLKTGTFPSLYTYSEQHNFNVVIKPKDGSGGTDVFHCTEFREIEKIAISLLQKNRDFVVSPYHEIVDEFRAIILDDEIKILFKKVRPSLIGDGLKTIRQLTIEKINEDSKILDSFFPLPPENISKNFNLDRVPLNGERVYCTWKHNLAQGALADTTISNIDRENVIALALQASKAVNIRFASVDIVKVKNSYLVIEINSGVMMEKAPQFLKDGREVAKNIYREAVRKLFSLENSLHKTSDAVSLESPKPK